jgi:hypothetical protein
VRPVRSAFAFALVAALPLIASAQAAPTASPPARPRPAQLAPDSLERARTYTAWLYTNQTDSLFAHMDSASRAETRTPQGLEAVVERLASRAGTEESLISERWVLRNGLRQYWRTAKFSLIGEPFLVRLVLVAPGTFSGVGLGLASQAPPIDP